jgi:hypothetical protein
MSSSIFLNPPALRIMIAGGLRTDGRRDSVSTHGRRVQVDRLTLSPSRPENRPAAAACARTREHQHDEHIIPTA